MEGIVILRSVNYAIVGIDYMIILYMFLSYGTV